MLRNSVINIVLKIGLSLSLLYVALASLIVPVKVLWAWPSFIANRVADGTLASLTGIICFGLIIWLFFGRKKFASSAVVLIAIALTGLCNITNVSFLFILAPLFFIALALCLRYYPRVRIVSETFVTPLHEGHLRGEKDMESPSLKHGSHINGSHPSQSAR
jgi:hypothetical protein